MKRIGHRIFAILVISSFLAISIRGVVWPANQVLDNKKKALPAVSLLLLASGSLNHIQVSPGTVLLTDVNQTKLLFAKALDKYDKAINTKITWHSSDPSTVSVDQSGMITSHSSLGSAWITAEAEGIKSQPVLVMMAQPVAHSFLVSDNQVFTQPVLVEEDAPLALGTQLKVTLIGMSTPPGIGKIIIATGESPIGGRVVSVDDQGNGVFIVTFELVTIEEMFDRLKIDEEFSLKDVQAKISPEVTEKYTITRGPDGSYIFTLKPGATFEQSFEQSSTARSAVGTTVTAGPFSCETSGTVPVLDIAPVTMSINPQFNYIVNYDSLAGGLQRLIMRGSVSPKFEFTPALRAALDGKFTCKFEPITLPIPITGALSTFFGGFVPLGLGFELGGRITLAEVKVGVKVDAKVETEIGMYQTVTGDHQMINNLNMPPPEATPILVFPVDPTSGLQFEAFMYGFGYAGLDVGIDLIVAELKARLFEVKGGVKASTTLMTETNQILDTAHEFKYGLSLELSAGLGGDVTNLLNYLSITLTNLAVVESIDLARSPTIESATIDNQFFLAGDTVNFDVVLKPDHLSFTPFIPYNVEKILIYRKVNSEAVLIDEKTAATDQKSFNLSWFATDNWTTGNEFYAFVNTTLPWPIDLKLDNVKSDKEPCAAQGLPGPETNIYNGLEWQRCVDDGNRYNRLNAINECEDLNLNGYSDWRLPTKEELKNLVICSNGKSTPLPDWDFSLSIEENLPQASCCTNYPECDNYVIPTIHSSFHTPSTWNYMSSTVGTWGGWAVIFNNGISIERTQDYAGLVRCVR